MLLRILRFSFGWIIELWISRVPIRKILFDHNNCVLLILISNLIISGDSFGGGLSGDLNF